MPYRNLQIIKSNGFVGFHRIQDLWQDSSVIPKVRGIYLVVQEKETAPVFLREGTGGFFKGQDPNVDLAELKENWVTDSPILYIGKAGSLNGSATLHSRIRQYLQFGRGKNIGHRGGRYIWQLQHAPELLFGWQALPNDDLVAAESILIQQFKREFNGRPFANLKD